MLSFLKRKDPVCGMVEKRGTGLEANGRWFCSSACLENFKKGAEKTKGEKCGCCP